MMRVKRKAAVECEQKLHKALGVRQTVKKNKLTCSTKEIKSQACSVKITKGDFIPQSILNAQCTKPCSVKLCKNDSPANNTSQNTKNCVYMSLPKSNPITLKRRRQTKSVRTTRSNKPNESVYDFFACSQSSQSSDDDSMKNVLKELQKKKNVQVVKRPLKRRAPKKDLLKTWNESNIKKAKQLIKPKVNKLPKLEIMEVLKNDVVTPIKKLHTNEVKSNNESILPQMQDIIDCEDDFGEDHFGNAENDIYGNDENENISSDLRNSNIENINPNSSPTTPRMVQIKPLVRSPLKPLNTQIVRRQIPSPKKPPPLLRNQLLKRLSLYNSSIISSIPQVEQPRSLQLKVESRSNIENSNATNYFGFTTDLVSEPSIKNLSGNTSTPLKPTTKETLLSKLKTLKASVVQSPQIKNTQRVSTRNRKKSVKQLEPIQLLDQSSINFKEALSSTLLQPAASTVNKNVRHTYSRHQNKNYEMRKDEVDLFDSVIGEPLEQARNFPLNDSIQYVSPTKKTSTKVYKKKQMPTTNKKKYEEQPELLSFYESFNIECEEINKFKPVIE